ncbi:MAG: transposase [Acidobacteriota bacterium]|nr:transposase [Acidobacteriota bacterium]
MNCGLRLTSKIRIKYWQTRGLYIFYLPTYSSHLNIAETVWRKLKYEWLAATEMTFGLVVISLKIKFQNLSHAFLMNAEFQ